MDEASVHVLLGLEMSPCRALDEEPSESFLCDTSGHCDGPCWNTPYWHCVFFATAAPKNMAIKNELLFHGSVKTGPS
ncbi:hypothetical protein CEXT_628691 [Caerostris extrusa]|uniref:Uncharacterized protein n=1 Tax=Caerostris extrusa TaxID=172846 RepID=A0AAV4U6U5_CAEEX|nr:hypothetical protein CEXT_628691 [Caerostris extrusa]